MSSVRRRAWGRAGGAALALAVALVGGACGRELTHALQDQHWGVPPAARAAEGAAGWDGDRLMA